MEANKKVRCSLRAPQSLVRRHNKEIKEINETRTEFMRDRDRIMYSKAFRRLSGKTQVFLTGLDDHQRTRLTHTLEVSQIARTIAYNLDLDVDLTEAIALGHDIGHTPYGHVGERTLHMIMTNNGGKENAILEENPLDKVDNADNQRGFKHNLQSVQTAIKGEKNYKENGMDLTNFTLFGMAIHSKLQYSGKKFPDTFGKLGYYEEFQNYYRIEDKYAWSFEAYVVKQADEIAQRHHDLEDAIRGEILSLDEIRHLLIELDDSLGIEDTNDEEEFICIMSRKVVDFLVNKLIDSSCKNMNKLIEAEGGSIDNFDEYILKHDYTEVENIISFYNEETDLFKEKYIKFENHISKCILAAFDIQRADAKGQYIVKKLFQAYYKTPQQLPDHSVIEYLKLTENEEYLEENNSKGMGYIRNIFNQATEVMNEMQKIELMRVICNYIAGMTDAYAQHEFDQLYN